MTAGAPPAAATIERLEEEFGWDVTQVYGLTGTVPLITVCAPLPEHEKLSPADRAVFVTELPKTATGKIQKFVLRQGPPTSSASRRRLASELLQSGHDVRDGQPAPGQLVHEVLGCGELGGLRLAGSGSAARASAVPPGASGFWPVSACITGTAFRSALSGSRNREACTAVRAVFAG